MDNEMEQFLRECYGEEIKQKPLVIKNKTNETKRNFQKRAEDIQLPRKLVTVTKLPTGALETQINDEFLIDKITYILDKYDDNLCLLANKEVQIVGFIIV